MAKELLRLAFLDLVMLTVCGGFFYVGYLTGQLHPKYSPEEQMLINEVERKYNEGFYNAPKVEKKVTPPKVETKEGDKVNEAEEKELKWRIRETGIVAETIWREARGEDLNGRLAVASVIVNRMKERKLSASGVCLQRKQFSCWNGVDASGKPWTGKNLTNNELGVWIECVRIAGEIVRSEFKPIGNWNHYYNPKLCNPSWGRTMESVSTIGNHLFGRV